MDRTVTEDGGQPGQITEADIDGVEDNRDGQTEGVGEPGATPNPAKDEDDRDNREMDVAAGRRDKTRAKTAFTKARRGLLAAIANSFTPSEIDGCTAELDERMEEVLGVMDELAALLEHQRNREAADRIVTEMEKIEEEYSAAQDRAAEYCEEYRLRERRRDRPRSGLRQRQRYDEQPSSSEEEQNNDQRGRVDRTPDLVVVERPALAAADREHRDAFNSAVTRDSTSGHESRSPTDPAGAEEGADRSWSRAPLPTIESRASAGHSTSSAAATRSATRSITDRQRHTQPSQPRPGASNPLDVGADLWQQLKRVTIPTFSGDKRAYTTWRAAFMACIDQAPATAEYKLLQLRQYLRGDALKAIDGLGHSAAAYDAAKARLDRKYGGERRRVATHLEAIQQFAPVRPGNPDDLDRFADLIDVTVVNLKDAGRTAELGNSTFYQSLQKKLPETLLTQYQRWVFEQGKADSVESLQTWVCRESEFQAIATETIQGLGAKHQDATATPRREQARPHRRTHFAERQTSAAPRPCGVCKGQHEAWACPTLQQLDSDGRWERAKQAGLCFRCLGSGHTGTACRNTRPCGINGCTRTHHRLLHRPPVRPFASSNNRPATANTESGAAPVTEGGAPAHTMTGHSPTSTQVALRTVPVTLRSGRRSVTVNALLDDGSTQSYLNSAVAAELGIQAESKPLTVATLNGQTRTFQTMPVHVQLESCDSTFRCELHATTADRVTGDLQAVDWQVNGPQWRHLQTIPFPSVGKHTHVDVLIGVDHPGVHTSLAEVRGTTGEPIARLTPLGWTCIGPPSPTAKVCAFSGFAQTFFVQKQKHQDTELNHLVRQLWEVDGHSHLAPPRQLLTKPEAEAVQRVERSCTVIDGRYQVTLPWKDDAEQTSLPDSYPMALRRLEHTERRLRRDPEIAESYSRTIRQYADKGYIVKAEHDSDQPAWYLPHFAVLRPDKETTKTRIVFDASAAVDGVSLNSRLHAGPKLQRDLVEVLTRFRKKPVAAVCDISEMYLQISLEPDQRRYHRFLWRDLDNDRPPDVYEFQRVVFGVNASPFLAQYVTQQHARTNADTLPLAADAVLSSTYMDDTMTSVEDSRTARQLYDELTMLWQKAGLHARKWLSNSTDVLAAIPPADRVGQLSLDDGELLPSVKTLGLLWKSATDEFSYSYRPVDVNAAAVTKRSFLKRIAKIFDPLGLITPFTVRAKTLLQQMWLAGCDWDEPVTEAQNDQAIRWFSELPALSTVTVPRCLRQGNDAPTATTLHVFTDASEQAYGAVGYLRHEYPNGSVSCRIVSSKVRVAPLTATSIPRLELMGAVIGLRIAEATARALEVPLQEVHFWTDSQNVLGWIRNASRHFKPFVANRVGEIHRVTEPSQWQHVATKSNPADLLTRGLTATQLAECDLWWNGPPFLVEPEDAWPAGPVQPAVFDTTEMKRQINVHSHLTFQHQRNVLNRLDPTRFSDWTRLVRVRSWVIRFITNCLSTAEHRTTGEITPEEFRDAELSIIQLAQRQAFRDEIGLLDVRRPVRPDSKIASLNPTLDEDNVLRAQTRLEFAEVNFETRHPIILPRRNWVTTLIVKKHHEQLHHVGGTNHTLAALSSRFWIVSAREAIREWERECNHCRRLKARAGEQIMAPLPPNRAQPSLRAFAKSSIDYAGPFITVQGRGRARTKRYLCLFTCMTSRAVHLEMAYDLSTDGFLNAFFRMASRRGLPEEVTTDNGTNFVGADNELRDLVNALNQDAIRQRTSEKGIRWRFNPPAAPHFGGAHESLVKSAKRSLNAILKNADVNDEELMTSFIGAEALLNSRPLTYQSAHPADATPLTPNHFLHGQMGGEFAPRTVDEIAFNPRRRWRRVQELLRHFWQRWTREWLPSLAARQKWRQNRRNLRVGDIVLVVGQNSPRGEWPLARVAETFQGRDGQVRVARVEMGQRSLIRPISKLCFLLEE